MRVPSLPDRTLCKYYAYSGLSVWQFIAPINVLFMESQGLSFVQISVTLSAFSLGIVAGEIPTGYVGDRIGRRRSLLLGVYLVAGSIFVYGLATEFWEFLAVQLVWTVGVTFMSGSSQAWLYDVLRQSADEERFARVRGRASALNAATAAVAIAAGGYLYSVDQFYPFAAATGFMATAGLVLFTFPASRDGTSAPDYDLREVVDVLRYLLVRSPDRRFVVYAATLAGGFAIVGGVYVQPMATSLGVSERHVGWLFAGATAVGVVANSLAGRIHDHVGVVAWFRTTPLFVAVLLALVVVAPVLVLPAFLLTRGWNDVSRTLRTQYVNDRVASSENRATVLSAVSMAVSLVESTFLFATGVVSDATGPAVAVGTTGVVLSVVVLGLAGLASD